MSKQKGKLTKSQKRKYGFAIAGTVILCIIYPIAGIILAVVLAKKKKKWLEENLQNEQAQSQQATATDAASCAPLQLSKLPNIPEQTQDVKLSYREINGGDLFDICKKRDEMSIDDKFAASPIHLHNSFGRDEDVCILYALQYGKTFEERTYAVWLFVDEDGETGKAPFAGQILRKADGSTELLFVDNDDFAEVIFGDMNARMEREMKAKGLPTASDEEETQGNGGAVRANGVGNGRLGRLKSRFNSGVGETNKTRVSAFVGVSVMYLVILIVGLVVYLLPNKSLFPLFDSGTGNPNIKILILKSVCLGYLLVTPSALLYFGAHNPFNIKKSLAMFFIVLGIVAMIACDIYGLVILSRFANWLNPQDTGNRFIIGKFVPIALCVSTVAYTLVYLVWCKGLSSKWYAGMAYVTTVLFPVATVLILAVIALYIVWTLLIWLLSSIKVLLGGTPIERGFKRGWSGKGQSSSGYEIIDESGYRRTLTPYEGNRYRDDTGAFWVSDDGGNSFRRD